MMSRSDRTVRVVVTVSALLAGILATMMFADSTVYSTAQGSLIAAGLLFCSAVLMDSALFGRRVRPETAGLVAGLSLGFFLRQSAISEPLAQGAARVAGTAFVISLGLALWRAWRRHKA